MNNAIVLAFDDQFAQYAIACLNSIYINYPDHPEILAYYAGADPAVLSAMERVHASQVAVTPPIRARFSHVPLGPVGQPSVYDRFVIWTDELNHYDRILYLDVDTLVLGSLEPMFAKDRFFAVANHEVTEYVRIFHPDSSKDPVLQRLLHEDGIDLPTDMDDMINAGVLFVPRRYRSPDQLDLLLRLAERYGALLHYADQSLLSLWCLLNHIRPSKDYRYNFQSPFLGDPNIQVAFDEIRILHFSGQRKPPTPAFRNWERLGKAAQRCETLFLHYARLGRQCINVSAE